MSNYLNQKGFAPILGIFAIVGILGLGGVVVGAYILGTKQSTLPLPSITSSPAPAMTADLVSPPAMPTPIPSLSPRAITTTPTPTILNKSPSPSVTNVTSSLKNIPVISTQGWKEVSYKGVNFKIPPESEFRESQSGSEGLVMEEGSTYITLVVTEYAGGSRREQYYQMYPYARETDCHEIYEEVQFGNVKVLEIARDVGWCQGSSGATIAVIGTKLVVIPGLGYDPDTKIISRAEYNKALISTLKVN